MPTATLTSKGQVTIPKSVREALGVDAGDRVEFLESSKGVYTVVAVSRDVRELKGLIAKPRIDWAEMMAFKRTFTDAMPGRIEAGHDRAGIATLQGSARFTAPDTVEIDGRAWRARHFHIATGARPATLGIPGEEHLITSTDFLELPECPRRIVFVGGGYIALEFAHIAARAGAETVTVLQRGPRILPNFDPDLTAILAEATLSFLGLGLVDDPSWGQMLNQAVQSSSFNWWLAVFPGGAIFLTVFAYNLVGEALRDAVDPHTQRGGAA